jgi:rhamnogalacturonyl hydrolase YesR
MTTTKILPALVLCATFYLPSLALAQAPTTAPGGGLTIYSGSQIAPDYPVPYRVPTAEQVADVMGRVRNYVNTAGPARAIHRETGEEIKDLAEPDLNVTFDSGEGNTFRLISYEQGVTYAAMVYASQVTGDQRYAEYVKDRFDLINKLLPSTKLQLANEPAGIRPGQRGWVPMRSVINPRTLDDCGAMCAGMIKARQAKIGPDMMPVIQAYIEHINNGQFRLSDGTLARKDPQPETLWLDDLYMSVPALAQMGKLTGDEKYFDDAAKQVLQFSSRMFNKNLGIYMHGWASNMPEHPEFHWARANGWAIMAMTELLEVMPQSHPQRAAILDQYRAHLKGLASFQSGEGRWHNLLDRTDSYLETSATAMYVYAMARGINRGWITPASYGPAAVVGWNAVAEQVNALGQVENTCVGTGMAFEPAYYYARPRSVYAAHGYGPTLLAGAEMIQLLKHPDFKITGGIIQFVPSMAQ